MSSISTSAASTVATYYIARLRLNRRAHVSSYKQRTVSREEYLDILAMDMTLPVPLVGGARFVAVVFDILGGLLMLAGVLVALSVLTKSVPSDSGLTNYQDTTSANAFLQTLLAYVQTLGLALGGVLFIGGVGYLAVGVTVAMIADMRIEMASTHRLLAGILEINLRPPLQTSDLPFQAMSYPDTYNAGQTANVKSVYRVQRPPNI